MLKYFFVIYLLFLREIIIRKVNNNKIRILTELDKINTFYTCFKAVINYQIFTFSTRAALFKKSFSALEINSGFNLLLQLFK